MRRALLVMTVALSSAATAQDSARVNAVRALADSIRAESCRGGKLSADGLRCTGSKIAPRMSVIRRLTNRLDSLTLGFLVPVVVLVDTEACVPQQCYPTPTAANGTRYLTTVYYNSLGFGYPEPGRDTVTVCAVLEMEPGVFRLAWPPVLLRVRGDSASFTVRDRGALPKTCARAINTAQLPSLEAVNVSWVGEWLFLHDRYVWRPFPVVP
jgi:hypothetical protein